jgi:hypothetical protein
VIRCMVLASILIVKVWNGLVLLVMVAAVMVRVELCHGHNTLYTDQTDNSYSALSAITAVSAINTSAVDEL